MLRAIVERHEGLLPVDTVEGIWRIIISTFTYVQAPYAVHIDVSPRRVRRSAIPSASISASPCRCSRISARSA